MNLARDVGMNKAEPFKRPLLGAVTVLYLLIPAFFFAVGWLKPPFMLITLGILTAFAILTLNDIVPHLRSCWTYRRVFFRSLLADRAWVWLLLALGCIIVWLSLAGIGGIGHQNDDYTINNPFFKLLIAQDWPSHFSYQGESVPAVYYVAYQLPAAFIGKLFGWLAANRFIFIWTAIGVFLSFAWFFRLSQVRTSGNRRKLLGLAILFCLASGMDYVGQYVWTKNLYMVSAHIELWSGLFEYSSQTTLLYWVPQHALPGWLLIGLIGDSILHARDAKYLGIAVAAAVLWSPWVVLGSLPFLAAVLWKYWLSRFRHFLFNPGTLLWNVLSLWIGLIHISYIAASRFSFPIGFIWQLESDMESTVKNLAAFYGLEFGFLAFLVLLLLLLGYWRRRGVMTHLSAGERIRHTLQNTISAGTAQFGLFCAAFGLLWILPLFKAGYWNVFLMRASIPALFIFWAFIVKLLLDSMGWLRVRFGLIFTTIVLVVLIGFITSYSEIIRSATHFNTRPDDFSWVKDFSTIDSEADLRQRAGNENAFFFRVFGK